MFCGNLFSVDYPCLSFNQTLIHFQDLVVILQRICETEKCQLLMLKEINSGDTVHKFLIANGFRKYGEDFTMKLDIPEAWESFEDYFRSLTKKYRKRLSIIQRSGSNIEVRRLDEHEISENLPRIEELFNQTATRQFLRMGIIDGRYFTSLLKA